MVFDEIDVLYGLTDAVLELDDVAGVGITPAVDSLAVITDYQKRFKCSNIEKLFYDLHLVFRGILELVNDDVLVAHLVEVVRVHVENIEDHGFLISKFDQVP